MKNVLIILFLVVSNSLFAQKYIKIVPEIFPDSAGCNGKARGVLYNGVPPYQLISWWSGSSETGVDLSVENVCDGAYNSLTVQDSECAYVHSEIRLFNDTSLQVYLDTVLITMPSGPGMCDGSIQVFYTNITPNHSSEFILQLGPQPYSGPVDSTFTYTGLCEGSYSSIIRYNSDIVYLVGIDLFLTPTTYYNCELFESEILINSPSSSSACDGGIIVNPIYGPNGPYRHFIYYNHPSGGSSNPLNPTEYDNYAENLCSGSYTIQVQNDSSYLTKYYRIFLDTNGITQVPWNFPDSLLPDTDTILLNALMDCNINYNIGVDTAYISSFNGIGNNQYDIEITFIQDTNTIIINSYAVVDTSLNFFLDITTFCPDSSRSSSGYYNLRSMFYHGVKIQPVLNVNDHDDFSQFTIYPNPSENIFQIDFETEKSSLFIFEISDITGKIIYTENFYSSSGKNQRELYLSDLTSGMYFLNVFNESKQIYSDKIIRQ